MILHFSVVKMLESKHPVASAGTSNTSNRPPRARICKRLRSPGIDSEDSILPAYVAWQAGTITLFDVPARQVT